MKPCSMCGEPAAGLTRAGRCSNCMGVHTRSEAEVVVDAFTPYERDAAAQMVTSTGGFTLEAVGELIGVSRERVRQIERAALGKVRAELKEQGLSLADLATEREGADRRVAPAMRHAPAREPDEPAPRRGSVSWARAGSVRSRDSGPVVEELYSPEGQRLAAAVLELEARAARIVALIPEEDPSGVHPIPTNAVGDREEDRMAITWNGETKTVKEWAAHYGVTANAIYYRINRGRNVDGTDKEAEEPETPRELAVTREDDALDTSTNVCEHGDHPAPAGKRFCSLDCAECETGGNYCSVECERAAKDDRVDAAVDAFEEELPYAPSEAPKSAADFLRTLGFAVEDVGLAPNGKRLLLVSGGTASA